MIRSSFKSKPRAERVPLVWPGKQAFAAAGRCDDMPAPAQPKPEAKRNPHLLAMARGQSCLLKVPGICNNDPETTVAAHSNFGIHGKAKSRKADDQYHVYACSACHAWLDQGPAPSAHKEARFMRAHLWMVEIWRWTVDGYDNPTPKDRAAARWALEQLNAFPVSLASVSDAAVKGHA